MLSSVRTWDVASKKHKREEIMFSRFILMPIVIISATFPLPVEFHWYAVLCLSRKRGGKRRAGGKRR